MPEPPTKLDLIIEVWERLDCESIGRLEIEAIEKALAERFGKQAVESPMVIARQLADEGAELRHNELMTLFVERAENKPYDPAFRNIFKLDTLGAAHNTIRQLENLRRKFETDKDRDGLRLIRDRTIEARETLLRKSDTDLVREIASWLTMWLQSPELFENWIALRIRSQEFLNKFEDELK
ncbi:MAG: hypothetical protein H0V76_03610 [Blastocatellia bacterium]|nr:hypothetical protein [Blastocatellia bacterium]